MSTFINNIYFGEGSGNGSGNPADPSPGDNPTPNIKDPSAAKGSAKKIASLAVMAQLGKSIFSYATSHVEMFTGSSDKQDKVNTALSIAGTIGAIAANPVMGTAMAAFNLATKAIDYMYKQQKDNLKVAQTRLRAGPNVNKSRL